MRREGPAGLMGQTRRLAVEAAAAGAGGGGAGAAVLGGGAGAGGDLVGLALAQQATWSGSSSPGRPRKSSS